MLLLLRPWQRIIISCSKRDKICTFVAPPLAKDRDLVLKYGQPRCFCCFAHGKEPRTSSSIMYRKHAFVPIVASVPNPKWLPSSYVRQKTCSPPKYQSTVPAHFPFQNASTEDFNSQNLHPRTPRIRRHRSRIMSSESRGRSSCSGVPNSNSSPGTTPLYFSILSMYSCPRYPSRQYYSRGL